MPQSQIWERDEALQAIECLVSEARTGRGRSLFIVGEAGLGKTTMVERARAGSGGDFKTSIGRGDAAESSLPFGIIDQALRGLGLRSPGQTRIGRRPAVQARAARLYAALQFLEALPSPTLLLLDDLHWADEDSLALLAFLCRRISNLPIALIGTLRPWPQSALDTVGPLTDDGEATIEHLRPLSDAGAAQMLSDRAGGKISPSSARRAARLAAGADRGRTAAGRLAAPRQRSPLDGRDLGQPSVVDVHLLQPVRPATGEYVRNGDLRGPCYCGAAPGTGHPGHHGADGPAHRRRSLPARSFHAAIWQHHPPGRIERRAPGLAGAELRSDPGRDHRRSARGPGDAVAQARTAAGRGASGRGIPRSGRSIRALSALPRADSGGWFADQPMARLDRRVLRDWHPAQLSDGASAAACARRRRLTSAMRRGDR